METARVCLYRGIHGRTNCDEVTLCASIEAHKETVSACADILYASIEAYKMYAKFFSSQKCPKSSAVFFYHPGHRQMKNLSLRSLLGGIALVSKKTPGTC